MRSASGALQGIGGIAVSIATLGRETCVDTFDAMCLTSSRPVADMASAACEACCTISCLCRWCISPHLLPAVRRPRLLVALPTVQQCRCLSAALPAAAVAAVAPAIAVGCTMTAAAAEPAASSSQRSRGCPPPAAGPAAAGPSTAELAPASAVAGLDAHVGCCCRCLLAVLWQLKLQLPHCGCLCRPPAG